MPFKKGQSGNPAGRPPKGEAFADALRVGLEEIRSGKTTRERIVRKAIDKALAGDLEAMKWIVERTDGKVKDVVEADTVTRVVYEVQYADSDDPDHAAAAPLRPDEDREGS